jgi:hypothetical protein
MAPELTEPKVMPVWHRDKFPNPNIKLGPLPELLVLALEWTTSCSTSPRPTWTTSRGSTRSTAASSALLLGGFDGLTAKLWQCHTRALALHPRVAEKVLASSMAWFAAPAMAGEA